MLARIAGVEVPTAESLLNLAETLVGTRFSDNGRTAEAMGIAGLDRDALLQHVRR